MKTNINRMFCTYQDVEYVIETANEHESIIGIEK